MQHKDTAAAEYDIVGGLLRTYSSSKSSGSDYALGSGDTPTLHPRRQTDYHVPSAADVYTSTLYDVADDADATYDAANAVDARGGKQYDRALGCGVGGLQGGRNFDVAATGQGAKVGLQSTPYVQAQAHGAADDDDVIYDIGAGDEQQGPGAAREEALYDHGDGLDLPAAHAPNVRKTYALAAMHNLENP